MRFKIIFLDIDGVMNAWQRDKIRIRKSWRWLDVEPEFARNLFQLIKKHKAKIVLSSSWRLREDWRQGIIDIFKTSGSDFNPQWMIDRTPRNKDGHRGREILRWLKKHRKLVENYVILDDDGRVLMPEHNGHVVLCDKGMGFTKKKTRLANQILAAT